MSGKSVVIQFFCAISFVMTSCVCVCLLCRPNFLPDPTDGSLYALKNGNDGLEVRVWSECLECGYFCCDCVSVCVCVFV